MRYVNESKAINISEKNMSNVLTFWIIVTSTLQSSVYDSTTTSNGKIISSNSESVVSEILENLEKIVSFVPHA